MAAFQFFRNFQIADNAFNTDLRFTVPVNNELIIEVVSGQIALPRDQLPRVAVRLVNSVSGTTGSYFLPTEKAGRNPTQEFDIFILSQLTKVHVAPGTEIVISIDRLTGTPTGRVDGEITLTGQLLDVPGQLTTSL